MKTLRVALTAFAALFSMSAAASSETSPFVGDRLIFVADNALYKSDTATNIVPLPEFAISVDKVAGCKANDFDSDNGWICKYDSKIATGKRAIKVKITYPGSAKDHRKAKVFQVMGTVVLRAEDKKAEYPDNPTSGEQFWCVLVSKTKLSLMSASDERCHTD